MELSKFVRHRTVKQAFSKQANSKWNHFATIFREQTHYLCFIYRRRFWRRRGFNSRSRKSLWVLLLSFVWNQVNSSLFAMKINWKLCIQSKQWFTECHGSSQHVWIVQKFLHWWRGLFYLKSLLQHSHMTWEASLFLRLEILTHATASHHWKVDDSMLESSPSSREMC